jgi:hypothetical protein
MTDIILRFATITHAHPDSAGLITSDGVEAAAGIWRDHPLAAGISLYSTAARLKSLKSLPEFVNSVAGAFPCNLILANSGQTADGQASLKWTIGLRHRLADIFCQARVDYSTLIKSIAEFPLLCAMVRRSIPDAQAMGFLSAIEIYDLSAISAMSFPEIGRFSALAVADFVDPAAAVHPAEHKIIKRLGTGTGGGPVTTRHDDHLLLNWLSPEMDIEAAWRRRLAWLADAAQSH